MNLKKLLPKGFKHKGALACHATGSSSRKVEITGHWTWVKQLLSSTKKIPMTIPLWHYVAGHTITGCIA